MSTKTSSHIYNIIVNSTQQNVWKALTDGQMTQKYFFGSSVEAQWVSGASYQYKDPQGNLTSEGKLLEVDAPNHLKMSFKPGWLPDAGTSTLSWDLQALDSLTLLSLTHADIDDATFEAAQMHVGWIYVLSSLKTLLETGNALPTPSVLAG